MQDSLQDFPQLETFFFFYAVNFHTEKNILLQTAGATTKIRGWENI
jgi:hypothetical protein